MSTQPAEPHDFKALLQDAFDACDLSIQEVWFRYWSAGGNRKNPTTLWSWVRSDSLPDVDQYEIIERVINGRLAELGKPPMLPSIYMSYSRYMAA